MSLPEDWKLTGVEISEALAKSKLGAVRDGVVAAAGLKAARKALEFAREFMDTAENDGDWIEIKERIEAKLRELEEDDA